MSSVHKKKMGFHLSSIFSQKWETHINVHRFQFIILFISIPIMGPIQPSHTDIKLPVQSGLYTNHGLSVSWKYKKMIPKKGKNELSIW
jgi:hypothetical protein